MRVAILAIRFLLELAVLAALAAGGWELGGEGAAGTVAAVAAAVTGAVVWGIWVGPRSSRRLVDPQRPVLEIVVFALGGAALWTAWSPTAGVALVAASTVVAALTRVVGEPTPPAAK